MNLALARLARRRSLLIEKSTLQREQLELYIDDLRPPINTIDKCLNVFRFIKLHPLLMLGATIAQHQLRTLFFRKWVNHLITFTHVSQLLKRLF